MCDVKRRSLLLGAAVLASAAQETGKRTAGVNTVDPVTEGVYFHEGDIEKEGYCNNGWIVLRDYVLVMTLTSRPVHRIFFRRSGH